MMLALSIRQPWVELILRGIKAVEYRRRPTRIIGQRFYIYAAKGSGVRPQGSGEGQGRVWSRDLAVPSAGGAGGAGREGPPGWMLELARVLILEEPEALPRGLIVGSATISRCTREQGLYHWHLEDVQRIAHPRKPARQPQPMWFRPF